VLGDESAAETLTHFLTSLEESKAAAPHADAIMATPEGRRQSAESFATNYEHIPAELLAHMLRGVAGCEAALPMLEYAMREGYSLEAEKVTCPVRIVWGTADQVLEWPSAAARYRGDGIGHCPQLDVPLETAQLILGFTAY
jgi:pimeloyl-ACP methyl ester carboxylesterase